MGYHESYRKKIFLAVIEITLTMFSLSFKIPLRNDKYVVRYAMYRAPGVLRRITPASELLYFLLCMRNGVHTETQCGDAAVADQMITKTLTLEEVVDLMEESQISERKQFGAFDLLRVTHPSMGAGIIISSHGDEHVLIHV